MKDYDPKIYLKQRAVRHVETSFWRLDSFYNDVAETLTTGTLSVGTYCFGIDSYYSANNFASRCGAGYYGLQVNGKAGLAPAAVAPEP